MIIQTDSSGHITGYAQILAEGVELEDGIETDFQPDADFYDHYYQYVYQNGQITKDIKTLSAAEQEQIRAQRQKICFPVINRGALWYRLLSDEQVALLESWYRQWLDAPQTGLIPELPAQVASLISSTT